MSVDRFLASPIWPGGLGDRTKWGPLVIDDSWIRQRCEDRRIDARPIPANDADDETQQRFLGWLLKDVLQTQSGHPWPAAPPVRRDIQSRRKSIRPRPTAASMTLPAPTQHLRDHGVVNRGQ
jgi:hypothetical protein